jgi:uncharacterized protein (TIGR02118 family)
MAYMVVIYKTPKDPEAFDRHYFEKHVPLAKGLPGLRKYEVSRGPIASPVGPSDAYMIATLHFDNMAAIQQAFASEIGRACSADRKELAPDTSSFQTFLFESREL